MTDEARTEAAARALMDKWGQPSSPTNEMAREWARDMLAAADAVSIPTDREPQPTDGPEYHADHADWERRQRARDVSVSEYQQIGMVRGFDPVWRLTFAEIHQETDLCSVLNCVPVWMRKEDAT